MQSRKNNTLEESEEQLRMVFENANEVIIVAQDEKIKYCNPQIKELTGYSLDEIYTMNFIDLIHPDDLEMVMQVYQSRLSGEKTKNRYSARTITKDDQEKFILVSSNLVNWDGEPATLAMITDITQLKKTESDLKLSEERYELAARGSAAGIWDWDMVTGDFYFSEQLQKLLGYEPGEFKDSLEDLWDRMHPDDIEATQRDLDLHLKKQKAQHLVESRMRTKSGEYRWFQASSKAVWDDNDKPIRLAGSFIDINDRKNAEEKISKSEHRFRQLMEQSPLAMEVLSPDGKITLVNTAWKKLWKVSDEEAAETVEKYNMLTDPQNEKLGIMDEVRKAFKGKHIILPPVKYDTGQTVEDFDLKLLKKFKSPWIQCHLNSVKDANGEIVYIVNTYVDITDLKEAEETLSKSEARYRHLMEHSPLSIAIFTEDGKLNQVNAAWKNLWGLSEEETLQVMENYNIFTDKQMEDSGHAPLVVRAFKGEDIIIPPMEYEGDITTKEIALEDIKARSRWIQSHLYSVQHANGDLNYVVNINMDLTELKHVEEEAKNQREVLARIDRASSMGQLTGSIAHELNQPLTGILGNAQAIEMMLRNDASNSAEILEIMGDIVADTKRAGDVIRNLRELYREQKSEFKKIDINILVDETLQLLHSEFVKYDVKVKNILAENMPEINGNKVQVQQVLVNLLMNAIEAMNGVGVENYNITITTATNNKVVKVYIDDNGPGIDEDKIDLIFQPLATWKSGGTGMGLAISNSIIESHGGTMQAKNLPDRGARVWFKLPIIYEN
jgi:PAS domain S-box-containing protein